MARLTHGSLRDAWKGEASDFTPLLAQQLDLIGEAIGQDLVSIGHAEVATTGGRSIDIVAQTSDGPELVIENQYGQADHDHLTRGLAYAVARGARGLVLVAEHHRDEFRAVAQYLNEMAEHDRDRGIAVWLVEAKAVRIGESPWAPLFSAVVRPNEFTATVEQAKQSQSALSLPAFLELCETPEIRAAAEAITARWAQLGHRLWRYPNNIALAAQGPGKTGERSVLTLFRDGRVMIPFSAYRGANTGIPIPILTTTEFESRVRQTFSIDDSKAWGYSPAKWLDSQHTDAVLSFATEVADAYASALAEQATE